MDPRSREARKGTAKHLKNDSGPFQALMRTRSSGAMSR